MSDVSVIIPLYGDHVGSRRLPEVVRAWLDQRIPTTVIITTAGELPLGDRVTACPGYG